MAFTAQYPLSEINKVRLEVGDIDAEFEILPDDVYQYLLDKNSNNIRASAMDAAKSILFALPSMVRERTGQIEVYGDQWATNYREALKLFLTNPNLYSLRPMPYAGGISVTDMTANNANADNVRPALVDVLAPVDYGSGVL